MAKKDNIKIFIDEIYCKSPKKKCSTNEIIYNHNDEIWSFDLTDMIDNKISNNKGFRNLFVIIDNLSKYLWGIPLKNKYSKTITDEFSNILTTSKRKPLRIESDRGTELYNSIFQNLLKAKNIRQCSRFTEKGPSIAERVIRILRNFSKKSAFLAGNADWLSELPSVIKQYNNTIHHSTKMFPVLASKKANEKLVNSNLQDKREKPIPKYKLGDLLITTDIKRVFSKGDSTNYSYKLYTKTGVIHDILPSYRLNYLPESYNENLLLPTKPSLEQINQIMKELNLIQ